MKVSFIANFRVSNRDITKRKFVEETLRKSEERYRLLFNSINDAILVHEFHDDGSTEPIVEVNDITCKSLEYAREELLRMSTGEITPREARTVELAMMQRLRAEEHLVYESTRLSKSGRKFPVEISNRLFELNGKPMNFSTIRDITECKHAELALRQEATRRRILFEEAQDGIVILGQDLKVVEANRSFQNMLGYSPEEIHQLHVWDWDVFYPTEKLLREKWSEPPTARGTFESRHRRKDGSVYEVEISRNPAPFPEEVQMYCVCRDITERKRLEERLERERALLLRKTMRELNALRGILPICASCKKIRDDQGYWHQVENYMRDHAEVEFSHGICPECAAKLYTELEHKKTEQG
jgi:PAS domain S-box-containing protein